LGDISTGCRRHPILNEHQAFPPGSLIRSQQSEADRLSHVVYDQCADIDAETPILTIEKLNAISLASAEFFDTHRFFQPPISDS
jgi:hypothetical protein